MKIKLNNEISIDLPKLITSKLLIQANSGGGKSWLIRRIVEQAYGKVQIIILDPEGEFSTLREKYDFILAGKGGDTPAEPKSAALLAHRLLELKVSTIIDLYELHPQERKHFVKLFLESMVNAPKHLHHDVLIVLDEAHMFAPEKGDSEALNAVIDLASRGRKRGFGAVLATQRISKLHKDAAAECNNKLIGRTSLDIDRKRAADELGITDKENILALRALEPGEFFAFGPAISNEVIRVKVGDVKTSIPKAGRMVKVASPSASIKKVLSKLVDLPQEAKREAMTIQELKKELAQTQRDLKIEKHRKVDLGKTIIDLDAIDIAVKKAIQKRDDEWRKVVAEWKKYNTRLFTAIQEAWQKVNIEWKPAEFPQVPVIVDVYKNTFKHIPNFTQVKVKTNFTPAPSNAGEITVPETLARGARSILSYLHSVFPEARSKTQLWVATGYSPGGGFNNCIYELTGAGLITKTPDLYVSTERHDSSMIDENFDASLDKWKAKLSLGARKVFELLLQDPTTPVRKEELAEQTGYALGGGFNNNIYELTGAELIKKVNGGYMINPEILEL